MFLGLITRCKDEFFIEEFCNYYLSQGVDKIYIIEDNSNDKTIYDNLINNSKVKIIYNDKSYKIANQMFYVDKLYKEIKSNFKWIISVDVDEFITTKRNADNTIKDELISTFAECDCIKIPWVMMSSNGLEKNPDSILKNIIYRWNHDKRHPSRKINRKDKFRCRYEKIEVKCIFKTSEFSEIKLHIPNKKKKKNPVVINSINMKAEKLDPFYENLREIDIEKGYFLCYHYRCISKEYFKKKLTTMQYNGYSFNDMVVTDYSEIKDETIKNKYSKLYPDTEENSDIKNDTPKDLMCSDHSDIKNDTPKDLMCSSHPDINIETSKDLMCSDHSDIKNDTPKDLMCSSHPDINIETPKDLMCSDYPDINIETSKDLMCSDHPDINIETPKDLLCSNHPDINNKTLKSNKNIKIFIIGFNKCGTRTLHYFFKDNNLKSIHWDNKNLVDVFENNIKNGNKLLENGKTINKRVNSNCNYSEATVFSDMTKNIINKDAKDYYKQLDNDYPNSKFILNTRNVDKWIQSRIKHNKGKLLNEQMKFHNCDRKQLKSIWKKMYKKHIKDVKDYFKDRKSDLCIFDIENDIIDIVINFLKNDFILDKKYYKHVI